jgi:acetyl esterase
MPLDPDIARLIDEIGKDPSFPRPTETDLAGARASHEHDAAHFAAPGVRSKVAAIEPLTLPGPAGGLAARIYRPQPGQDSPVQPTIVWFHGGGWTTGSLDTGDILSRELCAGTPAVVLSIDYRLAPENPWPAAIDDASAALTWAKTKIDRLGNDPARIAIGGDSAGGNIAAVVAQASRDNGIELAVQILIYPYLDLDFERTDRYPSMSENAAGFYVTAADLRWCVQNYLPGQADPADPAISPMNAPTLNGLPTTVLAVAEFDPLRDQGTQYGARLRDAGILVIGHPGTGLIHGYADMLGRSAAARAELNRVVAAAAQALSAQAPASAWPDKADGVAGAGSPARSV